MRDVKCLLSYTSKQARKLKDLQLFKKLKKEVVAGANGTMDYVFKKGKNSGKTHKTKEK